ncbi:hypothetical protein, partial [Leuconostoc mesenteroides]|uniref:hypothetical protein n=1 Tax=Leuconostoc mesenteroides TaxID=1245 RepID=UPI001CBB8A6F
MSPAGTDSEGSTTGAEEATVFELSVWSFTTADAPPILVSSLVDDATGAVGAGITVDVSPAGTASEGSEAGVEEATVLELPVWSFTTSDAPPILVSSLVDDATESLGVGVTADELSAGTDSEGFATGV